MILVYIIVNCKKKCIFTIKMTQYTIADFISFLEFNFPSALQESYDNSGIQIGDPSIVCEGILIALDVTQEVVDEAVETGCNLILSHHPLIFNPLKNISPLNGSFDIISSIIKNDICVYSLHTNFDKHSDGVSDALADKIGLQNKKVLQPISSNLIKLVTFCPSQQSEFVRSALFDAGAGQIGQYDNCSFNSEGFGTFRARQGTNPYKGSIGELHKENEQRIEIVFPLWKKNSILNALLASHPYEEVAYDLYPLLNKDPHFGLGIIGELEIPLPTFEFLTMINDIFDSQVLKTSKLDNDRLIKRVAVCGGAGASLMKEAIAGKADAMISADLKYHDFQYAYNRLLLIDAGHYETEVFALMRIKNILSEKFTNFATLITKHKTNFVSYLNK